jgi:hypothetical protein
LIVALIVVQAKSGVASAQPGAVFSDAEAAHFVILNQAGSAMRQD